jgi:hypothetical protein
MMTPVMLISAAEQTSMGILVGMVGSAALDPDVCLRKEARTLVRYMQPVTCS